MSFVVSSITKNLSLGEAAGRRPSLRSRRHVGQLTLLEAAQATLVSSRNSSSYEGLYDLRHAGDPVLFSDPFCP